MSYWPTQGCVEIVNWRIVLISLWGRACSAYNLPFILAGGQSKHSIAWNLTWSRSGFPYLLYVLRLTFWELSCLRILSFIVYAWSSTPLKKTQPRPRIWEHKPIYIYIKSELRIGHQSTPRVAFDPVNGIFKQHNMPWRGQHFESLPCTLSCVTAWQNLTQLGGSLREPEDRHTCQTCVTNSDP